MRLNQLILKGKMCVFLSVIVLTGNLFSQSFLNQSSQHRAWNAIIASSNSIGLSNANSANNQTTYLDDGMSQFFPNGMLSSKFHYWKHQAKYFQNDSLSINTSVKWYETKAFRISLAPAILVGVGLFTFKDNGFLNRQDAREFRNRYFPTFHDDLDDYMQYGPAILAYGLKFGGVKGMHNIPRFTVNLGISSLINWAFIGGLKQITNVERPDGSDNRSFPSGHTATAFFTATLLHKEYGHISPLYSIAGYSMATMTGVLRQLNDKHWISDVLVGAGLAIFSVELGYVIADALFNDWGVNPPPKFTAYDRKPGNPSFLLAKVGYANVLSELSNKNGDVFSEAGFNLGAEGAFFFTNWLGIGGEFSIASFPMNSDNLKIEDESIYNYIDGFYTEAMGTRSTFFGPYVNFPLSKKAALVGKVIGGWSSGAVGTINAIIKEEYQETVGTDVLPIFEYNPKGTWGISAGISARYMLSRNIGLNLFLEYNYSKPDVTISTIKSINPDGSYAKGEIVSQDGVESDFFAIGLAVSAMLW